MTNPPGPPPDEQSPWARPAGQVPPRQPGKVPPARPAQPPSESPTRQIPLRGGPHRPPPPPPPTNRPRASDPPNPAQRPGPTPNPQPHQPRYPAKPQEPVTTRLPIESPSEDTPAPTKSGRHFFGDRLSILLVAAVVVLTIIAALIGAELFTRHAADSKIAQAMECEVQDSATVSFDGTPPVLWQYLTSHYTNISVKTAGNQVRVAKGMTVDLDIQNVKLNKTSNSEGTIGALNGTITWTSDGIKQSVQDAIPVLGSFVASSVTTNPNDGTIELKGLLDSIIAKPQIVNNGLSLQIVKMTALGNDMSTQSAQKSLDDLTSKATQNYPLGIHADSVQVTDSGLQAKFSTSNAAIPASSSSSSQDSCFSGI